MRWDDLLLDGAPVAAAPAGPVPLLPRGAVTRTFDTPGFRGITFHEVTARSALNKVPDASRMPFRWTINPYRGCSHACVYCASGDTLVLMGDGRTKALEDVRPGDVLYGTEQIGHYRRYRRTTVLAHWRTTKPAFRIVLADGTTLVTSGDHRFLTERGWKHVTGAMNGDSRRPHLTTGNSLLGFGTMHEAPKIDDAYRRGYLTGMIRGDGHLGRYSYRRPGRARADVYRFRLALTDDQALDRTQSYLESMGIPTQRFSFTVGGGPRAAMQAIRNSTRAAHEQLTALVSWPDSPDDQWRLGFLAGIFDAEGSHSGGVLRICNSDATILEQICNSMDVLGFRHVLEPPRRNGCRNVRIVGGVAERMRFLQRTDPAITRKRDIAGLAIKSDAPLDVVSIEDLGLTIPMYDITTGTGDFIANGVVSHNCFARKTHEYLDLDSGHDFDSQIVVKTNVGEVLRRELARPTWAREHVAMGTNVDCYQRVEGRYRLMRDILPALTEVANPFSILTKGVLILRDLDLLTEAAAVTDVSAAVSVGFVDETLWRSVEPGTPSPQRRLDACSALNEAGIPCGVLMAPVLPFLTDSEEQLEATVAAVAASGATHVSPIVLHLRSGAREWWQAWLRREHPHLLPRYAELYGTRAYAPKAYQRDITDRVRNMAERHGIGRSRRVPRLARPGPAASSDPDPSTSVVGDQLSLL